MEVPNLHVETPTTKQRMFIGTLFVLSIIISVTVLFYFSPANAPTHAAPNSAVSHSQQKG
jgi:uncharacterized protein YpmB